MGSLTTALLSSASALSAFSKALNTVQNNVANVNTPGYARQELTLLAQPFDPTNGIPGGVTVGGLVSSRSAFLEQAVRGQNEQLGAQSQKAADLQQLEPLFDLNAKSGVAGSLNQLFADFSQLSINPNSSASRQTVIDQAGTLAASFNRTADGVTQLAQHVDGQTRDVAAGINRLSAQLAEINRHYNGSADAKDDPGLDTQAHAALEELSSLTNFAVLRDQNGAFNVYLSGQTPIALGAKSFPIAVDFSGSQTAIRDAGGIDITAQIVDTGSGGRLGALLEEKNVIIPGYSADLNTLAEGVADQVNSALAQGVDSNGQPGANLFQYDAANGSAFTLKVTGITSGQLAAASAGAPGGNGNAVAIAQLADSPTLNGYTFSQAYGNLGGRVGRDVASAKVGAAQAQDLVTQAQARRAEVSGVSLDAEAVKLLLFQRSYEAATRIVAVISELTKSLLSTIG